MIGPMTPLFSNPEFPPAMEVTNYLKWNKIEHARMVTSPCKWETTWVAGIGIGK